jgi:hypothetical protein
MVPLSHTNVLEYRTEHSDHGTLTISGGIRTITYAELPDCKARDLTDCIEYRTRCVANSNTSQYEYNPYPLRSAYFYRQQGTIPVRGADVPAQPRQTGRRSATSGYP